VLAALAEGQPHPVVLKLAVTEMPGSGKPAEMLHAAGIDADCIAAAARDLVQRTGGHRTTTEVGSGRRD
jgi:transketolase